MADSVVCITETGALAVFILWALGYGTRLIPRLLTRRIARLEREGGWTRDTVEYDPLGVLLTVLPAPVAAIPCLLRWFLGMRNARSSAILLIAVLYAAAILFQTTAPRLRYNTEGIFLRAANGKAYFIPYSRVAAVDIQQGTDRQRKWCRRRLRPLLLIRYDTHLPGRLTRDTEVLDPASLRGIRRFLDTWSKISGQRKT